MAQTLTFTIKFNVDPPNVQQALDAVNTSLKNVGVSITNVAETAPKVNALDDSFTKIGLRLQGIQNLFNIVTSSFGSIVAASNAAESATVKLSQALQNQGIYTQELVAEMQAFASARQELTGIDDDATVAIMGQLTAMGLQGQALKDATVAVQDLATLMDGDMNGAVRVVADAEKWMPAMVELHKDLMWEITEDVQAEVLRDFFGRAMNSPIGSPVSISPSTNEQKQSGTSETQKDSTRETKT